MVAAEAELSKLPQGEFPVEHFFAPGQYGRKIFMAAGSFVIGKIHKHSHINVLSKGKVRVATEFGTEEFEAPRTWVSPAGVKRAVTCYTDTVWTCFHNNPNDLTDLDALEDLIIAKSYEELDGFLAITRG